MGRKFINAYVLAQHLISHSLFQKKIIPRLKSWIRKFVKDGDEEPLKRENSRPSLEEEAAAAAKAASEAAIYVAKASQEMLNSKSEEMKKFEEIVGLLNMQLYEMKKLTSAISRLEGDSGRTNSSGRASVAEEEHHVNLAVPKQLSANGKMDYDFSAVKSSTPQTQVKSSTVPHPSAYMGPPWKVSHAPCYSNPSRELQRQGGSYYSTTQNYGTNYLRNGDGSASWRQQHNVRIHEQPILQSWVPPQPPPVPMPEAAEAIRRFKSTVQTETLANNQLIRPPLLAR